MEPAERFHTLRIAVTGSGGFIGTHLMKRLEADGAQVCVLHGDVRLKETWTPEFDIVFHLAAALPRMCAESPFEACDINLRGVLNALEACSRSGARIVLPSTAGVYSPRDETVVEDDPVGPQGIYAQSKLMAEMLCKSICAQRGMTATVFRIFNVYGEGQDPDFIMPYLAGCAVAEKTAELKHAGSYRDFVHVSDVVDAMIRALDAPPGFRVYNTGGGRAYRIADVAGMIGMAAGSGLKYREVDAGEDPLRFSCADISRCRRELGWRPKVTLEDGIARLVGHLSGGRGNDAKGASATIS